ncbi:hypothetical protein ECG_00829 [Echinococcus granulosus]|uniref:Serine rich repeat protein n=1 Tax=Echinococcus granulosus TaxID=6210 RepID=A0A068W9J6_ECHGR|nr:hypothetical protein ECG_00829 [Echinococcus granulosus]CDS16298.1 serine rich repeat protein [Echinococcus granulosus]
MVRHCVQIKDLENQALSTLAARRVPKWEVIADNLHPVVKRSSSELRIKWPRFQHGNPSSYRPISLSHMVRSNAQVNIGRSGAYLEKRNQSFRRHTSREPSSTCSISYLSGTSLSGPASTYNQENDILPKPLQSNFSHSFKRRMHLDSHFSLSHKPKSSRLSNSTSSTSLSPIEDLNFDALNDPTDETLAHPCHESSPVSSSFRYLASSDDFFVVQTPSKSISESDQKSFHLSSPPSGFGNLGGATNAKSTNSFRPRVLFGNNDFGSEKSSPTPFIERFNVPPNIRSPKQRFSYATPLNQPKSSTSDSIALSMAKMTVWNRMAAATTPIAPVKTQQFATNVSRQGLSLSRRTSSASSFKLAYPVQKEPEFTIRRILQVAYGRKWRRFALGENRYCENVVQMAHQFLDAESKKLY